VTIEPEPPELEVDPDPELELDPELDPDPGPPPDTCRLLARVQLSPKHTYPAQQSFASGSQLFPSAPQI
jgi:hypothetical protein